MVGTRALPSGADRELWSSFREQLRRERDLVVVFGSEVKGPDVARLVRFGDTLEGSTRYIALADYNNSRGAADMGLFPDLLPGYVPVADTAGRRRLEERWKGLVPDAPGLALDEMMAAAQRGEVGALYVVGANPLKRYALEAGRTFFVVQDLFLTETAERADVVLPASSAYEIPGTVTNTCGEVQRLNKALTVNGPKPDLEILGLIAKEMGVDLGSIQNEEVFEEIRQLVKGYDLPMATLLTGGAVPALPLDGRVPHRARPELIYSANDTLFTSGTLGRYSNTLNSVVEKDLHKNPPGLGE